MSAWYDDRALVASMPARLRLLAAYSRIAAVRSTGRVRGGSFLFRRLREAGRLLRLRRTAPIRVGTDTLWVDLEDARLLAALVELRQPDAREGRILDALLPPAGTFIDIGANHGVWCVLAARRVGPHGRLVAVEPNPVLAECVRRTLADGGVPADVHGVALGSTAGRATLFIPAAGSGSGSLLRGYADGAGEPVTVDVMTLDAIAATVQAGTPCVVKLDVEGFELAVLRGGMQFLRRVRPVIFWELNPTSIAAAGHDLATLLSAFLDAGYDRCAELDHWPETVPTQSVAPGPQRNLVALPAAT